jgi:hypothetical protein
MVLRSGMSTDAMTRFGETVTDLRSAGERFDQGSVLAARKMAVQIRRLVHHCAVTPALLDELGVAQALTWVDTAGVPNPKTAASAACLTLMKIRTGSQRCGEFVPKLGLYPPAPIRTRDGAHIDRGSRIPFEHWWTNPVVKDADGEQFSRKQLVLALTPDADPEASAAYAALAGSPSLRAAVDSEPVADLERNPVMASVRQIGYEVLQTLGQQRDVITAGG